MKFGQIQGGTIWNVLVREVIISGNIRSYGSNMQSYLKKRLTRLAKQFHSTATISFRYDDSYPTVVNHGGLYAALSDSSKLHELEDPVLQAEDLGIYTQQYLCVLFFLGVGDAPALYDPTFDFGMDVLKNSAEWHETILFMENLLEKIDSSSKEERVNNDEFIQSV